MKPGEHLPLHQPGQHEAPDSLSMDLSRQRVDMLPSAAERMLHMQQAAASLHDMQVQLQLLCRV